MRKLALALAASAVCALSISPSAAVASVETVEAQMTAASAASIARQDMIDTFGDEQPGPGEYLWRNVPASAGAERVVIGLSDQLAYLYRGETLVAVASISTAKAPRITPTGIFTVLEKRPMYRSKKYDNAPMPFMQRIDTYGIAMHAGFNPGQPASHGCIRLPSAFAKKLYTVTNVGTPVLIGA
ncbi:MAG: L,D-transpeptidase family protein [Sphingomonas sp.]|jgi:lipoprotein-anchoring transpeptidase ErfK/SrfK|nr:L,D-transpeptidase family protein [Sphingomonas sp.]